VQFYYFGPVAGINEITNSDFNLSVSPNPVDETTIINYQINDDGKTSIQLFDVKGQLIKTISDENQWKGKHSVLLDKTGIAAGTYLLKLNNNNATETKKVIIK
jgi:hypothetical protein